MAKGNPIVGLAHVVVSQQEMLEKANEQIEELKQELENLDRVKSQKLEDVYKDFQEESEKRAQAEELCEKLKKEAQNAKDNDNYFAGEYNRIKKQLLDLEDQLQRERSNPFHWQKFQPDAYGRMCLPLGHRHAYPIVDGLYRYTEEHCVNFYDEVSHQSVPVKNCYGIGLVSTIIIDGQFYICSNGDKSAELIGFSVRYIDDYIIMDELPEELKEVVELKEQTE